MVLETQTKSMLVAEFHSHDSFAGWDEAQSGSLRRGTPILDVYDALTDTSRWRGSGVLSSSFVFSEAEPSTINRGLLPLQTFGLWASRSIGSALNLAWDRADGAYLTGGVRRIRLAHVCTNRR